jgi:hypothetical protein
MLQHAHDMSPCGKEENMKKIIDGKRYDTETAECVYRWDNGFLTRDINYRSKALYRTKNGAWFVHRDGAGMSDTDIEAVSAENAYGFLEVHSDETDAQQAIEQYFSERVQEA